MSGRLPPLNPLRAFEATARRGSVSAAARELNVTHGAISHQIKALEESLGAVLFERGSRRLKLTAQGALLLPVVTQAFGSIAAATALMARPATSGKLTISCVAGLLSFWILPRLNSFAERFPDINVTLLASNDPSALNDANIDICILYGDGKWPDVWSSLWSEIHLFPVASPSLLNTRPLRSIRDLQDHVLFHGDSGREWNTWLTAADASAIQIRRQHFMSDARLSTEAALHGQGIALGDTITAGGHIAKGDLIVPFDLSVPAGQGFHVACRPEVREAPIVSVFIDWLFSSLDPGNLPEPKTSAHTILRSRQSRASTDM
ncbi:LysR substrate-binding domain-containing protein [Agrobacterium larrymoorei]|uniref:HTH-type transcriptional regulator TtuA n=1 Tax=Agrobacterium larrymoorei TaxID=160699 RepID=A0A4D7DX22_9HYPH|nr:LysR substrate-binding domain-containing protein [Agrobacterium larrymoorei]QCI99997.1 LysR family transcriptional regulator [Agrobacterium larrymoorei]QYA09561.1 LysR family transcriptional regulator [Agrobacterium larrymoorei]